MEVCDYRRVNESFRKRLVYHAGIDCGFFVELNPKMPTSGLGKDGRSILCHSVKKFVSHSITSTTVIVHPHGDAY